MGRREKHFAGDVINGAVLIERLPNFRWIAQCKCGAYFIATPRTTSGKCKECVYRLRYSELTEVQEQIIVTMCDNGLNMSKTGRALYMTASNVNVHCNKIKRKTGLDPRDFWEMQKLLELMKGKTNERKTD